MMNENEENGYGQLSEPTTQGDGKHDDFEREFYDELEDRGEPKSSFEQAIPVDKLKNGASNAYEFFQWGVQSLREQANKVNEQLERSESYHKAVESYEKSVKPKVAKAAESLSENFNNLYEKNKPKMDELSRNAQVTYEKAKEKVISAGEACKPTLKKASEKAQEKVKQAIDETRSLFEQGPQRKDDDDDTI